MFKAVTFKHYFVLSVYVRGVPCFVTLPPSLETWSLTEPGRDQVPATLTALLHIVLASQTRTAPSSFLGGCWGFERGSLHACTASHPVVPVIIFLQIGNRNSV